MTTLTLLSENLKNVFLLGFTINCEAGVFDKHTWIKIDLAI